MYSNDNRKGRIIILQRRIPQYRVGFFSALKSRFSDFGYDLDVFYANKLHEETDLRSDGAFSCPWQGLSSYEIKFLGSFLTYIRLPGGWTRNLDCIVVPHEIGSLTAWYMLARARLKGIPAIVWGHGKNFQPERSAIRADFLRRVMAKIGSWCFGYTELSSYAFREAGIPEGRIITVGNAVDDCFQDVRALRAVGGRHTAPVILVLGSLTPEKNVSKIFEVAELARRCIPDLELWILGSGSEQQKVMSASLKSPWIKWSPAEFAEKKSVFLSQATILLSMGMIGLNALDAFGVGLPIVTVLDAAHSPEFVYLRHDVNSLVLPNGVPREVANEIVSLIRDRNRLERLEHGALMTHELTKMDLVVEKFANSVLEAIVISQEEKK